MGISGLHRLLAPHCRPVSLAAGGYRGRRVGVDGMAWLHRGLYSCSQEILRARLEGAAAPWGARAPPYVRFFMKMVEMLRFFGICPVIVFDGCELPAKQETNGARRARREDSLRKVRELAAAGHFPGSGLCSAALSVTKDMVHEVCTALRLARVETIVAPYEADAQLGFLSNLPEPFGVAAVVSEDSDLVAYGCRCLIFKLDGKTAQGLELRAADIFAPPSIDVEPGTGPCAARAAATGGAAAARGEGGAGKGPGGNGKKVRKPRKEPTLVGLTEESFVALCVMAGCDYLKNIKGVGVMTALALLHEHGGLTKAVQALRQKGKDIPPDYEAQALRATLAFTHARVFCPETGAMQLLSKEPLPVLEGGDFSFLGEEVPAEAVAGVVSGRLRPLPPFVPYPPLPEATLSSLQGYASKAPGHAWASRHSGVTRAASGLGAPPQPQVTTASERERRQPFRGTARAPLPPPESEDNPSSSQPCAPAPAPPAAKEPGAFAEIENLLAREDRPCPVRKGPRKDDAAATRPVFGASARAPDAPASAEFGRSLGAGAAMRAASNPFSRRGAPLAGAERRAKRPKMRKNKRGRRWSGQHGDGMAPARPSADITAVDREDLGMVQAGTLERQPAERLDPLAAAHASTGEEKFTDSQETCLPPVLVPETQETLVQVTLEVGSTMIAASNGAGGDYPPPACAIPGDGSVEGTVAGGAPGTMNQQKKILSFFSRRT